MVKPWFIYALWAIAALGLMRTLTLGQAPAPPGAPIAATATVGILVNGQPIGATPNINFAPGNGMLWVVSNDPKLSAVDIEPGYNTALIATHDTVHYNETFCDSTNGTTLYTCKLQNKALTFYQRGEMFLLSVDTTCAAGCSLNVDNIGPIAIKQADGLTDPQGTLIAGQARLVWYDGGIFRLI